MSVFVTLILFCLILGVIAYGAGRLMAVNTARMIALAFLALGFVWIVGGVEWTTRPDALADAVLKALGMLACVGSVGAGAILGSLAHRKSRPAF